MTLKEQTITLKTTASKSRLVANTLWINHALARNLNVTEDSELQKVVTVTVIGRKDEPQPVMMMTQETAENLYKELGEVLGASDASK